VVINIFDFFIANENIHTMDTFKIEKHEAVSFWSSYVGYEGLGKVWAKVWENVIIQQTLFKITPILISFLFVSHIFLVTIHLV